MDNENRWVSYIQLLYFFKSWSDWMTDVPDGILDEETEERYLHLIFQTKIKINHQMIVIRYLFSSSAIGIMKWIRILKRFRLLADISKIFIDQIIMIIFVIYSDEVWKIELGSFVLSFDQNVEFHIVVVIHLRNDVWMSDWNRYDVIIENFIWLHVADSMSNLSVWKVLVSIIRTSVKWIYRLWYLITR